MTLVDLYLLLQEKVIALEKKETYTDIDEYRKQGRIAELEELIEVVGDDVLKD